MPTEPVVLSRQDFDDLKKLLGFTAVPVYDEGFLEAHHDGTTYRTKLEATP
ncbi:MAG TPA: hypothetical protein VIP28_00240 [Nocardioides sp.]